MRSHDHSMLNLGYDSCTYENENPHTIWASNSKNSKSKRLKMCRDNFWMKWKASSRSAQSVVKTPSPNFRIKSDNQIKSLLRSYCLKPRLWSNIFVDSSVSIAHSESSGPKMLLRYYLILAISTYVCFSVAKYIIKYFQRKRRYMKYVKHLTCSNGIPFIGDALKFFGKNTEGNVVPHCFFVFVQSEIPV